MMKNLIALGVMVLVFAGILWVAMPYCEDIAAKAGAEFVTPYSDLGTRIYHEFKLASPMMLLLGWIIAFGYVMYISTKTL
jgi:hypothetical protein